jgi:hypothetical protein
VFCANAICEVLPARASPDTSAAATNTAAIGMTAIALPLVLLLSAILVSEVISDRLSLIAINYFPYLISNLIPNEISYV